MNTAEWLFDWHRALGHMNSNDIIQLEKVTTGMTITGAKLIITCKTCDESKITKQPPKQDDEPELATQPLQRVHSDPCGPITPTARGRQKRCHHCT